MGGRNFPPLTPSQIIQILLARGYFLDHKKGDHRFFVKNDNGIKRTAQVDMGCPEYDKTLIPLLLNETGLSRVEFYASTKKTAKKINVKCVLSDPE